MNPITNGLAPWAQAKVSKFLENGTSPIEGAEAQPLSRLDAQAHESLIQDLADTMISSDQKHEDLDRRDGFIQKSVFKTGLTEDIRYQKSAEAVELAYDFGDGYHAQYMLNTEDKAVLVDLSQSSHSYDLAVFVDKKNPANSVLFAKDS
jgi:hypothetical protein